MKKKLLLWIRIVFESAGSGFEFEFKWEKMTQIKEKNEEKVPVDFKCWIPQIRIQIRIRIDLTCWIRIRSAANVDHNTKIFLLT